MHILIFFVENLGAVSEEHSERFHQEILYIKGKVEVAFLTEYTWNKHRDIPDAQY